MEQLRIEAELEKQHQVGQGRERGDQHPHRDSGVGGDMGHGAGAGGGGGGGGDGGQRSRYTGNQEGGHKTASSSGGAGGVGAGGNLKRSAINNSLLDLSDNHSMLGYSMGDRVAGRRGSVGSLGERSDLTSPRVSRVHHFRQRDVGQLPVRVGRECGDGEPGEFSPAGGGSPRHCEEQRPARPPPGGQQSHQGHQGHQGPPAPHTEQEHQETEDS